MRERDRERGPSPMRTIRENRGGSGGAQIVLISHGHYFFRVCMVVQVKHLMKLTPLTPAPGTVSALTDNGVTAWTRHKM